MTARVQIHVRGVVQGVGFRPHVYGLAQDLKLTGTVRNTPSGVTIDAYGLEPQLHSLVLRLVDEAPPLAAIHGLEPVWLDPIDPPATFRIEGSDGDEAPQTLILPDIATCSACRTEIFDPADHRFGYPFTNCTHCGPRYTIIRALPYDRARTTMGVFRMCARCRAEYEDPADRRFHAQPTACPDCGPQLSWMEADVIGARRDAALDAAVARLDAGGIVAVRGLGGFHLFVDAADAAAVARLRERKHREEKPLALMVPGPDAARRLCEIDEVEERVLTGPESPIVLLRRRDDGQVAEAVAPDQPNLGVMLPYTPLHWLLMARVGRPLVATSGNRSDEPICITPAEARARLAAIADGFLLHDRPILRAVDDSVVRVVEGRELVIRRSRGYAPLPVSLPRPIPPTLAAGAQQKNVVAVGHGDRGFLSQHVGDLGSVASEDAWHDAAASLTSLYETGDPAPVADLHPDYDATRWARDRVAGAPVPTVQHHHAHVLSCMADNSLDGPVLGVAWDGTGLGTDGTIWGGEFLTIDDRGQMTRAGHLRPFRLPGGDTAAREPRLCAAGLLVTRYGPAILARTDLPALAAIPAPRRNLLATMLEGDRHAPLTTSAGRLFDAIAALLDLRQTCRHEGQAAILLEAAATRVDTLPEATAYRMLLRPTPAGAVSLDWGPVVDGCLADRRAGVDVDLIARRVHMSLAAGITAMAVHLGRKRVLLTGGCFQNALLTRETVLRLRRAGLQPYWHQRIPPNDGGIALGQLCAVALGVTTSPTT